MRLSETVVCSFLKYKKGGGKTDNSGTYKIITNKEY